VRSIASPIRNGLARPRPQGFELDHVSVAVIIAVGVNNDGRREVLGMDIGSPMPMKD
jgi:hypothetical protein